MRNTRRSRLTVPLSPSSARSFRKRPAQGVVHARLPTRTRRLVPGDDVGIDAKRDGLLDGAFLRASLSSIPFHGGLVKVRRQDILGRAGARKILIGPFRIVRIGADAAIDAPVFGFGGRCYFPDHFLTSLLLAFLRLIIRTFASRIVKTTACRRPIDGAERRVTGFGIVSALVQLDDGLLPVKRLDNGKIHAMIGEVLFALRFVARKSGSTILIATAINSRQGNA
jgi:hypothetical protein